LNSAKKLKIAIVCGTRPELIKISSVVKQLEARGHDWEIFHTNQHYDENMDTNFWNELAIPVDKITRFHEKFSLGLVINWLNILLEDYDAVLVQGDTNSVLCGAIAARQLNIPIGHIEAGIRSYDLKMLEECNRQMVGRIATFNFCPTDEAVKKLELEHIPDNTIYVTGNTIVDAVYMYQDVATDFVKNLVGTEPYALLTMHRAELVDDSKLLLKMLCLLNLISNKHKVKIIYPIHPRTKKMLEKFSIDITKEIDNLIVIEPTSFTQTLALEKNAKFVITDSGGLQEETCILRVPCLTIRDNTERQETLELNNRLIKPSEVDLYLQEKKLVVLPTVKGYNPYGDGNAAHNIVTILEKNINV